MSGIVYENGVRLLTLIRITAAIVLLATCSACAPRRSLGAFQVLPGRPNYRLRAPDAGETPFPELPARFTPSTPNWVDIRAGMGLRLENAYYREGSAKRDLAHYLGTEVAQLRVDGGGALRFLSKPAQLKERPPQQPSVRQMIPEVQRRFRRHRFFYEILVKRKKAVRGAVLLGAATMDELDRLAGRLLADPAAVCDGQSRHCTIFPETCTVSVEIEIVANGASRRVLWGSTLGNVATHPRRVELLRNYRGRLTPVKLDAADPNALRLPLVPGDHVSWE